MFSHKGVWALFLEKKIALWRGRGWVASWYSHWSACDFQFQYHGSWLAIVQLLSFIVITASYLLSLVFAEIILERISMLFRLWLFNKKNKGGGVFFFNFLLPNFIDKKLIEWKDLKINNLTQQFSIRNLDFFSYPNFEFFLFRMKTKNLAWEAKTRDIPHPL